ncbi:glycoside hydrolase family 88 protein [Pedobacter sp. MC2016-15]|jgi:rhamnogalacturonyl hydrolase YesR|uniref:glycoside hydrolase family 88/105 protein n=1 Tax=Pedobacter sp. MC2016-15 TaxID=2994473 RepID=UPI0022463005|nr:glycoside hydrolase family 88 protein [Pedobacter sp. MC2016-15]MCX2479814.1 glycoside hydrolase family 88 protein [Pedobacter sp. MC2016-15]
MKHKMKLNSTLFLALMVTATHSFAQKTPAKKSVLAAMASTNAYFMKKWPDPGTSITTNTTRPSNIWTRAVYYEGLMALHTVEPSKEYYDYATEWGVKHKWGLRGGVSTRNGDNQACGQTYIDLYNIDQQPERIKDIKESIDLMMKSGKIDDWTWIDALQMGMPVFAKLGVLYKDNAYYEYMYKMYMHTKTAEGGGLYNSKDQLWWRDKSFVPPYKEPNGEDCYWSRGNGWVIAALVRVLDIMPKDAPHRDEYLKTYKEMLSALLPVQRPDGFWNVSLHDAGNFGGKETSGTALFVYGMAWGINNGFIDAKVYKPVLVKAWNAMIRDAVTEDGSLGFVQGTGKEPKDGQPVTFTSRPDFEDYGLGCFLLAGTEVYKLKK